MEQQPATYWRKCSSCKNPIALGGRYYVCSVSTCNNPRTGYVFCGIPCFERHLPGARHKDAGAIEKTAGSQPFSSGETPAATSSPATSARTPNRLFANSTAASAPAPTTSSAPVAREVLVIASRLKDYIQARADFNTSQSVMDVLSDHLRVVADRAIDNARADGRKTVMDRDFAFLKSLPKS